MDSSFRRAGCFDGASRRDLRLPQDTEEITIFHAFQHVDTGRIRDLADGVGFDPAKVLPLGVWLAVAGLQFDARLPGVRIDFAANRWPNSSLP